MSELWNQREIDMYYEGKKKEASEWLKSYIEGLKRIKQENRRTLLSHIETVGYSNYKEIEWFIWECEYITKKDKKKIGTYLNNIEWLPKGVSIGVIDDQIVSRALPSPLERLLGDNEWKSRKD